MSISKYENPTTPVVDEMEQISLAGNMTPRAWYVSPLLRYPSGKAYLFAVVLLSDICYWYKPSKIEDERSGLVVARYRKFRAQQLEKEYEEWGAQFGMTKREVKEAVAHLVNAGLVTRTIEKPSNRVFLEPIPNAIRALTFPDDDNQTPLNVSRVTPQRQTSDVQTSAVTLSNVSRVTPQRQTCTESTAKNTQRKQQQRGASNDDDAFDSIESSEPLRDTQTDQIAQKLQALGVTPKVARELATSSPAECLRQIELLPHRPQVKNPAPLLAAAIRDAYAAPAGYAETPVVAPLSAAETAARYAKRNAQLKHRESAAIRVLEAQSPSYLAALKKDKPNLNVVEYVSRIHTNELDAEMRRQSD